jgi:hypothetical protein
MNNNKNYEHWATNNTTTGVAYEERVTAWRWQLAAETRRGNLMSIIKAYNTIKHLLAIFHGKRQNARYSYQDCNLLLYTDIK